VNFPAFLVGLADRLVKVQPWLVKEKCEKCKICAKSCPADAITLNPYPVIDRKLCMECYCCNELCPEGAIEIRRSWLTRRLAR